MRPASAAARSRWRRRTAKRRSRSARLGRCRCSSTRSPCARSRRSACSFPRGGRRRGADARRILRGARQRWPRGGFGFDGAVRVCDGRCVELLRHGCAALPRTRGRGAGRRIYVFFAAASCFLGCILPFTGVLSFCDAFNGIMAVPNVLALFFALGLCVRRENGRARKSSSEICAKYEKNYRFFSSQ